MKLRTILLSVCGYVLLLAGAAQAEPNALVVAAQSPAEQATLTTEVAATFEFLPLVQTAALLQPPPSPSCANDCWRSYVSCNNAGGFLCNHRYTMCMRSCAGPILPTP